MVSTFQDDEREEAMITLFDLTKNEDEGRAGVDAFLEFEGQHIPFELKTTSKGSVTTVRDFGPDHIKKWENKHWLFGFFIKGEEYYKYGSPKMMAPWIKFKEEYIATDFKLAKIVPSKIDLNDMFALIGQKSVYSYDDAKSIQKKQYKKIRYEKLQDLEQGYSPKRMLDIIKDRAKYLIERGSTLNNPHIPESYFKDWVKITDNHSEILLDSVKIYFEEIS
jgi:hypothetical protein